MKLQANINLDLTDLAEAIENADNLEAVDFFTKMSQVVQAKIEVNDILDRISSVEADIKGLIDARAKLLMGNEWTAIKGDNFKITRSFSGAIYEIVGKVKKDFVVIKENPNSKAIDDWRQTHEGKLPAGLGLNEQRNTSIRITLK